MEFKAPQQIPNNGRKSVFLAGTIDIGNSEDWQSIVKEEFLDSKINILNPRRDAWDSSWEQQFSNPQFYQQVNWELNALERSDVILLVLKANSKSPISLLELGMFAASKKVVVCCEEGFYREGNVQIVCDRYNIPYYTHLDQAINRVKQELC